MRYDDKITIVTGGSKGIGEGCVRVFADAGATVVFCARNEKDARPSNKNSTPNALAVLGSSNATSQRLTTSKR